jgi:1-phosphofructokinase family hexose kinase
MIITVTPNTSIDKTLVIPHFSWGETIRSWEAALGMGGKGTDASWVLGELGIDNLALGFASGPTGKLLEEMLQERGTQTDFTWVEGDSRTNIILVHEDGSRQSTITDRSLVVSQNHILMLKEKYQAALKNTRCVILGGSLPEGVPEDIFREMIVSARQSDLPVVFDSSGSALKLGLEGKPSLIKPNLAELQSLAGKKIETKEDIYQAAKKLFETYDCIVIATLGAEGALVVAPDKAFFIKPPAVKVKSSAGAGDAILAGVAHSLAEKLPLEEGLRLGFAAAASVLTTLATADCKQQDVSIYQDQVQIQDYPVS